MFDTAVSHASLILFRLNHPINSAGSQSFSMMAWKTKRQELDPWVRNLFRNGVTVAFDFKLHNHFLGF